MTSSINCGNCEENFGKSLMENKDCTLLARPMYMRRKVSTIRDLPKGCGLFASRFKVDITDSDCDIEDKAQHNDSAIRDLPKGCGLFASRVDSDCANKRVEGNLPNGRGQEALAVDNRKRKLADIVQADSEGNAKLPSENKRGEYITLPEKSNHHQVSTKTKATVVKEESRDAVKVERNIVKAQNALNHSVQKPLKQKIGSAPSNDRGPFLTQDKKDSLPPKKNGNNFQMVPKLHNNLGGHENVARCKVKETMRLFQDLTRTLLHEVEAKPKGRARVDLQAAKILKEKGKYVNAGKQILGSVPGVEVGDTFQYRVELNIVGLHRQIQGGIDYVNHNGKVLATSIVASGGYADDMNDSDVLIYTGSGGNVMSNDKEPEDQKLERGNLALKNSSDKKNPVRVIRGSESADKRYKTYVYDGLYKVESYWQDKGSHGKLVYRFCLKRIPGQPELALKRR